MSLRSAVSRTTTQSRQAIVSRRYASHGPHWNPPSGYLFGEKPPLPGQKRERQSWEIPYFVGMGGVLMIAIVGYTYKPNTSIQDWAMEEAKKRMEARGDLPKYTPSHPQ